MHVSNQHRMRSARACARLMVAEVLQNVVEKCGVSVHVYLGVRMWAFVMVCLYDGMMPV